MLTTSPTTAHRHRRQRRGAISFLVVLLVMVGVLAIAVVVNYTFAYMVQLDIQRRSAILAETGVVELLDENLLADMALNQADDLAAAQATVEAYRIANNDVAPQRLELAAANVTVTGGRVDNVTAPSFLETTPYNSLRVSLERDGMGPNPVTLLMQVMGGPETVDVKFSSVATLDSRLVGFRPTAEVATPVAPLAIDSNAWFVDRVVANIDTNMNGRRELDVLLLDTAGGGLATGALVDFDGSTPFEIGDLPSQITDGLFPPGSGSGTNDLPGPVLGPATAGSPLVLPATNQSPGTTNNLVAAFNTVAGSSYPLRAFPIYSSYGGSQATLVGFIGARVLGAANVGSMGEDQLRVRLEPAFIVHFTAETDPSQPENIYVHKVRLTQ